MTCARRGSAGSAPSRAVLQLRHSAGGSAVFRSLGSGSRRSPSPDDLAARPACGPCCAPARTAAASAALPSPRSAPSKSASPNPSCPSTAGAPAPPASAPPPQRRRVAKDPANGHAKTLCPDSPRGRRLRPCSDSSGPTTSPSSRAWATRTAPSRPITNCCGAAKTRWAPSVLACSTRIRPSVRLLPSPGPPGRHRLHEPAHRHGRRSRRPGQDRRVPRSGLRPVQRRRLRTGAGQVLEPALRHLASNPTRTSAKGPPN